MELERNPGCEFDAEWLEQSPHINVNAVHKAVDWMQEKLPLVSGNRKIAWLLKAVTCIDLTTLSGDDTKSNVTRLCMKAADPVPRDVLVALGLQDGVLGPCALNIRTAAVCVYPARVADAAQAIDRMGLRGTLGVASVAAGFPSGLYPLPSRLQEIRYAVAAGASDIDIVIDRSLALTGQWRELYKELRQMREACGGAHLKAILATGELGSLTLVYRASLVAMMAGADFIKTSTGKEAVNATLPVSFVMCRAIRDYHRRFGHRVGFKPAGGLRTSKDALQYLVLVRETLGPDWLTPQLFRIGASGLLLDIQRELSRAALGRDPGPDRLLYE